MIKTLSYNDDVVAYGSSDDFDFYADGWNWFHHYYPDSTYGYSKSGYLAYYDGVGEYIEDTTSVYSGSTYYSYAQACPLGSQYKSHTGTVYASGLLVASSCNPRAWQVDVMGNAAYVDGMKVNARK
ncbi:hypothetical protein FOI68_16115 [Brevibacillus sp. LEMMJ03]|nr:hypothetical protein FOI68_16115 [Brevibacillus sp. LEMMJ03]